MKITNTIRKDIRERLGEGWGVPKLADYYGIDERAMEIVLTFSMGMKIKQNVPKRGTKRFNAKRDVKRNISEQTQEEIYYLFSNGIQSELYLAVTYGIHMKSIQLINKNLRKAEQPEFDNAEFIRSRSKYKTAEELALMTGTPISKVQDILCLLYTSPSPRD